MNIEIEGSEISITVKVTWAELAQALSDGRLSVALPDAARLQFAALAATGAGAPGGVARGGRRVHREEDASGLMAEAEKNAALSPSDVTEEEIRRICRHYDANSNGANLLWEIARSGEAGVFAADLKRALGLGSSQELAGIASGIGKVLNRTLGERRGLFLEREWRPARAEFWYRLPEHVRRVVLAHYG